MIRKIVRVTDPHLRKKSKPVKKIDKKVLSLIADLKNTLKAQKDPEGVGLAAPQIGKSQRVFVTKYKGNIKAFINPKILRISKDPASKKGKPEKRKQKIMEGCLSLPHHYGPLVRSKKVKVKYLTEKGKEVTETFEELEAQIVRHEIDHLNGVIFIDRLLEQKKPLYELVGDEWEEVEI